MPNGNFSNSDLDNRKMEKYRRIDLKLKFSFDSDIDEPRRIIIEAMTQNPKVVKSLEIGVRMDKIGEYELKVLAGSWVESVDYRPMQWEQLGAVKKALDLADIEIPYPKRTVFQGQQDLSET
tara:strand:- start:181 stop:546 length:366 start_codon:yes stop_codon:yes gene_type:complete